MATPELVKHLLDETRALVRAEALHAREEVKLELTRAARAGLLLGGAAALSLGSLSSLLVALGLGLPFKGVVGLLVVAGGVLLIAGVLGFFGYRALPLQPLTRTQESIKRDLAITRGTFA
jgi:hypothetical protein